MNKPTDQKPNDLPEAREDSATLSRIFQALANPVTRHFIELVAMDGRTAHELSTHFDLLPTRIGNAAQLLNELGFLRTTGGVERLYQFDERALTLVRSWLDRIAEIRCRRV
jgi:hypothetical protein